MTTLFLSSATPPHPHPTPVHAHRFQNPLFLSRVLHAVRDRSSQVGRLGRTQTGQRDPPVLGHVDVVLARHPLDLGRGQPREGEHPDLPRHERPVLGVRGLLQLALQQAPHGPDPVGHRPHLVLPLREEQGVSDDLGGDPRAVDRRVGDDGPRDALGLRQGARGRSRVGEDKVEGADALGVETEVFGVRLRDQNLEPPLVREKARRPGVVVERARGESLIGDVEEREVAVAVAGVGDGRPLVPRRVDARRVVGAALRTFEFFFFLSVFE